GNTRSPIDASASAAVRCWSMAFAVKRGAGGSSPAPPHMASEWDAVVHITARRCVRRGGAVARPAPDNDEYRRLDPSNPLVAMIEAANPEADHGIVIRVRLLCSIIVPQKVADGAAACLRRGDEGEHF